MATSPQSFSPRGETFHLLAREKNRPRVRAATARGQPASGDGRGSVSSPLLLFLFFFFFPFSPIFDLPQSTADGRLSLNRPSTVDFWWYRPVAGGPRTSKLTNRSHRLIALPQTRKKNFKVGAETKNPYLAGEDSGEPYTDDGADWGAPAPPCSAAGENDGDGQAEDCVCGCAPESPTFSLRSLSNDDHFIVFRDDWNMGGPHPKHGPPAAPVPPPDQAPDPNSSSKQTLPPSFFTSPSPPAGGGYGSKNWEKDKERMEQRDQGVSWGRREAPDLAALLREIDRDRVKNGTFGRIRIGWEICLRRMTAFNAGIEEEGARCPLGGGKRRPECFCRPLARSIDRSISSPRRSDSKERFRPNAFSLCLYFFLLLSNLPLRTLLSRRPTRCHVGRLRRHVATRRSHTRSYSDPSHDSGEDSRCSPRRILASPGRDASRVQNSDHAGNDVRASPTLPPVRGPRGPYARELAIPSIPIPRRALRFVRAVGLAPTMDQIPGDLVLA
ncbi:hypothetical protein BHE74_00059659 [Ensete ventricosum]|nr:hypothetical protein BHE74_00059659 [Ensete ventricosum]